MQHYLNVCDIDGAKVEPVDVLTFGSPCQDLSVAGKRAGLKHENNGDEETTRSGLFIEAVRIIKEMRENDRANGRTGLDIRPRYAVWENVPGAFSSNKGADFQVVLEELCKVKDPTASVPLPQKWGKHGTIVGDGFSVAWRTLDAQYWGVPQRRRRIFLVADFASERAGEILFKRESLRRYSETCGKERQGTAPDFENSTGTTDSQGDIPLDTVAATLRAGAGAPKHESDFVGRLVLHPSKVVLDDQGGQQIAVRTDGKAPTLRAETHGNLPCVLESAYAIENHPADSRVKIDESGTIQTLTSRMGTGGGNVPMVMESQAYTMKIRSGCEGGGKGPLIQTEKSATLACNNDQYLFQPKTYGISAYASNAMKSDNPHSGIYEAETARTLDLNGGNPACNQGGIAVVERKTVSGKDKFPTLQANCGSNLWLGNQEAFSGDYFIAEPMAYRNGGFADYEPTQNAGTLKANGADLGGGSETLITEPTYCLQGSMIGRTEKNGPQGSGVNEDVSFTLDATDRHGVAYCMTTGSYTQIEKDKTPTLMARDYKDAPVIVKPDSPSYGIGRDAYNDRLVFDPQEPYYIVRRLTPTECARLQGFPDWWADTTTKETLTDEEYQFWLKVRNTHAEINGKATKEYTPKQILAWYNKLHSDGAEYKMWGNGVALPCVHYVLEGIAEQGAKTLGSLFDGSGGFPLAGTLCGIEPKWASEIEPYPIAVTTARFGG